MKLTVYKNQYGYSTLCKNKDQNGNEQKCYMSVQFKRGLEPCGDKAHIEIEDGFFSCYTDRNGNVFPKLVIMAWYPDDSRDDYREPVGFNNISTIEESELEPDKGYVQGGGDIYDEWQKDHKAPSVSFDDLPF